MFALNEWRLIEEACEQRARQWHDQARRARDDAQRREYLEKARILSNLARRLNSFDSAELDLLFEDRGGLAAQSF